MRKIMFRARSAELPTGWVYGYFVIQAGSCSIINNSGSHKVIAHTEGHFTGLFDKNRKEIFEGDVVRCKDYGHYFNLEVEYVQFGWLPFRSIDEKCGLGSMKPEECEVIGNVYESPELLEM